HSLIVEVAGAKPLVVETTLDRGQEQVIDEWSPPDELVFASTLPPPTIAPPPQVVEAPAPAVRKVDGTMRTWGWVAMAAGVTGVACGVVFTGLAVHNLSNARSE